MFERAYLDAEMAQLIARMSVISEVGAAGYQPTGRSGATDSGTGPRGTSRLMAEDFARRYGLPFHACTADCNHTVAETDEDRRAVINDAKDAIARRGGHVDTFLVGAGMNARVAQERPDSGGTDALVQQMLEEARGRTPEEVERSHFRMTAKLVRKFRREAGLDPMTGEQPKKAESTRNRKDSRSAMALADSEAKTTEARRLESLDYSVAEISEILDVSRSTVERYLGRRAA